MCVLLGSTAFDGLSHTRVWNDLTLDQPPLPNAVLGTAGLAACIGFVAGSFLLATRASASYARQGDPDPTPVSWRFVHSLVPIAVGYTVAHCF